MFSLIAVSYLVDSAVLLLYAFAGAVPFFSVPLYAGAGLCLVGVFILLSDLGVNDRFKDHYLLTPTGLSSGVLLVGAAAMLPQAGFLFLCSLFITCGFTSLRANFRQSALIWSAIALATLGLVVVAEHPLAMPIGTDLERMATTLAFLLALARFMYIGNYSSLLRESLYRRSVELREAYRRIEELAEIDELTGSFNRRCIMRMLEEEIQRCRSSGEPLSAALIDLDWFKRINDRFGHPAGDEVLRTFSITIFANIRDTDRFGRYGGEEFLLILPGADIAAAAARVDRLRSIVAGLDWTGLVEEAGVTLSAGVAELHVGENADSLLARADCALYEAKARGRDRVSKNNVAAPPLQPEQAGA